MDGPQLITMLRTFADSPEGLIYDKNQIVFELNNAPVSLNVIHTIDGLEVSDGAERLPARKWIIEKLAQLPILARKIATSACARGPFVAPAGTIEKNYSSDAAQSTSELPDAVAAAAAWCNQSYAFASRVLYITSDAGEGKTTCINKLAAAQAQRFLEGKSHWFLVPVSLGGRPFLRLDEVIIAALSQVFRFQRLYFESFIELVRMGVIVLALDGFEEMFVEGHAGDAVSALGNLLSLLRSQGTVVIAARKAYFEYKSIDTQAKLFDSLRTVDVEFARLHLNRWDKERFLEYALAAGDPDPERLYSYWLTRVSTPDHPLLSRPVMVKHVVSLGVLETNGGDDPSNVALSGTDATTYFEPFVREILRREAQEKWVSRGDVPGPILTVDEHVDLLACVAREMWDSESQVVGAEILELAAEYFCERTRQTPEVSRQVVERIKQHALIVSHGGNRSFHFDHEEFFQFFLGIAIADDIERSHATALARLLGDRPIPLMALQTAAFQIRNRMSAANVFSLFSGLCESEKGYTSLRENCGNLAVLVGQDSPHADVLTLSRAVITHGLLSGRSLHNLRFDKCYFAPMDLQHVALKACQFNECTFTQLDLYPSAVVSGSELMGCTVGSVVIHSDGDEHTISVYAPDGIRTALQNIGFRIHGAAAQVVQLDHGAMAVPVMDERLRVFQRFLRVFARATGINEGVVRQRLGDDVNLFFDEVLPAVDAAGVVQEVEYRGSGTQRRFKLAVAMSRIQDALEESDGDFDEFLEHVRDEA